MRDSGLLLPTAVNMSYILRSATIRALGPTPRLRFGPIGRSTLIPTALHICSGILNVRALQKPDHEQLFAIAEGQAGYFTMAQAVGAGFARSTHSYHVHAGNWVREHRGIYCLKRFPVAENGDLVLWSLWSRDRNGIPQGVYSHETALRIHDLSDVNPAKLHMTVPPTFRRNSALPTVLTLHKARLAAEDVSRGQGYAVTTAIRSILDLSASGAVDRDLIAQACREGRQRGLITRKQIAQTLARDDVPSWVKKLLRSDQ